MKFPLFSSMTKLFAFGSMMLLTLLILTVADVNAQRLNATSITKGELVMAVGHDIRGCHNGARDTPELPCTGAQWANGNMGSGDSQWVEGEFVAIRDVITGLTAGSAGNTITLEYDTTKGGKHAFDYLGTYDASTGPPNGPGGNDPCSGVTCVGAPSTLAVPVDPNIPGTITQIPGVFTMWNAVITGVSAYTLTGTYAGDSTTSITITYTVNAGQTTAVLAFGAHVGSRLDWGIGNSAVAVNGSPYHISLGGGGGGTVQMAASAAIFPAVITIIKEVRTLGTPAGTTSTFSFGFNFTQGTTTIPFSLVDDVTGDGGGGPPLSAAATEIIPTIKFDAANPITVTEANYAPVWTIGFITCTELPGGLPNVANSTTSLPTRTANIIAEEAEIIVCTFRNTQFAPTAAPASISGRTVDSFGNGIGGSRVTVMDAQSGQTYTALTNPFGYYTVEGPEVGNFYIMTVSNKRYTFADDTRTFSLSDNLTDVDFIANPQIPGQR